MHLYQMRHAYHCTCRSPIKRLTNYILLQGCQECGMHFDCGFRKLCTFHEQDALITTPSINKLTMPTIYHTSSAIHSKGVENTACTLIMVLGNYAPSANDLLLTSSPRKSNSRMQILETMHLSQMRCTHHCTLH